MKTHDQLGRWLFHSHTITPTPDYRQNARQLRWMRFLNLHGLASSLYLHELTAETHRCSQTSKRMLRQLFDGQMVCKPKQQRETAGADGNYHVYDLTSKGRYYLKDQGLWVESHRPTGPWVHQYMVSCITSSIHIMCNRSGYTYIPGHEIVDKLAVSVPFTWNRKQHRCNLIPDSLFAIEYPTGFIAYVVEADRNTEPNTPASPYRKSVRRNVKQYAEFVGMQRYKDAYGLNCPSMVLNISVSTTQIDRGLDIVSDEIGDCKYLAYGLATMFRTPFKPPESLLTTIIDQPLLRDRYGPFHLGGGNRTSG